MQLEGPPATSSLLNSLPVIFQAFQIKAREKTQIFFAVRLRALVGAHWGSTTPLTNTSSAN